MHAIRDGWVRPAFALTPISDLEGRKSRIRRSKEERKSLAESFIKKYQKSNNGSFPSINITHKEVGGSFYTVREIVREIIQENLLLGPPKKTLEECDHSRFLEHPLGSMAMEPRNDFSVSHSTHLVMNKSPNPYVIKSEENLSSSSMQFYGAKSLDLKIINGLSKMRKKDEVYAAENHLLLDQRQHLITEEISNLSEQLPQPNTRDFETEIFVIGGEVLEENPVSDQAIIAKAVHIHYQDKSDSDALTPVQKFDGAETNFLNKERYFNKNNQMVEKTEEFRQRICTESAVMQTLDREKKADEDIEVLHTTKSHVNSDVMVETFPLEPLSGRIHGAGTDSNTYLEATGTVKVNTSQHDKLSFIGSCSGVVNEKDENKLPDSTSELDDELRDEKVVRNLQDPNVDCPKLSTTFESTENDISDIKVNSPIKKMVSEEFLATERNSTDYITRVEWKRSRPVLERINLETWKRESKKSSRLESNPLLELVKSYMIAFAKFWNE